MDYNQFLMKVKENFEKLNEFLNKAQLNKAGAMIKILKDQLSDLKIISRNSSFMTEEYEIAKEKLKNYIEIYNEKSNAQSNDM